MKNSPRLILIDDDKLFSDLVCNHLRSVHHFEVYHFETGRQLIDNIHLNPEIIILDYNLEVTNNRDLSGVETLNMIRKCGFNTPVIMFSSNREEDVGAQLLSKGVVDYIQKNDTCLESLNMAIQNVFDLRKLNHTVNEMSEKDNLMRLGFWGTLGITITAIAIVMLKLAL